MESHVLVKDCYVQLTNPDLRATLEAVLKMNASRYPPFNPV
jgi:hypothetical protein